MSKRFGRNQKRKMRDEIALRDSRIRSVEWELSGSRKSENETSRELVDTRRRLTMWADEVRHLMGGDSAFNERIRRLSVSERNDATTLYGGHMQMTRPAWLGDPFDASPITVQTVITALIWRLRLSRDEFSHQVRIDLRNEREEPIGYALPERHRWGPRDIEHLSEMIAHEMVTFMNRGRKAA